MMTEFYTFEPDFLRSLASFCREGGNAKWADTIEAELRKREEEGEIRGALIAAAREQYGSDEVEVDENAVLSIGDDGTWVQAWVWLENEEDEDEEVPA